MRSIILKCPVCSLYTFEKTCSKCDGQTVNPTPARYSPQDKYGKYRRALQKQAEGAKE